MKNPLLPFDASSLCTSAEWPRKVSQAYEPVKFLGKGGFGCVLLARPKTPKKNDDDDDELVAIKIVDGMENDIAYEHREVDILRALHHPNIMRVIDSWEPNQYEAGAIALSYSEGPTLQALLNHGGGGALSTLFSRVVIAQIVDAVAYIHRHAVLHRDIKPDNIIVTGAMLDDDMIWYTASENEESSRSSGEQKEDQDEYWAGMRNRWKATLIDFGFARALTPQDMRGPCSAIQKENKNASFHGSKCLMVVPDSSSTKKPTLQRSSSSFLAEENKKCKSFVRSMSAVGNYEFVAPEVLEEMHLETHDNPVAITDTIAHTVSEYGLLVDAYSLGCTLRYMMTGCLPHVRVKDAIARQNNAIRKFLVNVLLSSTRSISKNNNNKLKQNKREIHYRLEEDLPLDAQRLIHKMTEAKESKRVSVRTARQYPWIADLLPPCPDAERKLEYLSLNKIYK
eukprot:scaffold6081_cov101-Cylindrotheca_fusiformis.AAC.2